MEIRLIADEEKQEMERGFGRRKEGCAITLPGNAKFIEETARLSSISLFTGNKS